MPDIQEVYEMVTKQKPPEHGALERQQKRQVRAARNRKTGAFGAVVAIAVMSVALVLALRPSGGASVAADDPSVFIPPPAVGPDDVAAKEVVASFLHAYGAFDAERAMTYLADNADITGLTNGAGGAQGLSLMTAWLEATGNHFALDSCEGSSSDGASYVSCAFDYHGLRSDEIGRGPFSGSTFDFTVRNGKIVSGSMNSDTTTFSTQMWEPFERWVSKTFPADAAVMYTDSTHSDFRLTPESIRLWDEHTRGYVKHVLAAAGQ